MASTSGMSDADRIAEIEAGEAEEFKRAVEAWRRERAAGDGKPVIVEAGGAFVKDPVAESKQGGENPCVESAKEEAVEEMG